MKIEVHSELAELRGSWQDGDPSLVVHGVGQTKEVSNMFSI